MDKKWSEKTTFEKVVTIISGVALCIWLIFEFIERKTELSYAKFVNYIAICVICICETISFWKVKRSIAYIAIGGGICMIAVLILELL